MSELPTGAPPVCPRHPDRVSYVSCQRCGRPTCPQCQREAPVGVQCVDCVKAGAATVRRGRTVFGGEVSGGILATQTIIAICVGVFALQWARPSITTDIAFYPMLGESEPWRFLTSAFAHAPRNLLHIGFNMYALWILGQYLEPLLGRARFVAAYLISALAGSVAYLLMAFPPTGGQLNSAWNTPVVGASGAVFGLFGILLVVNRRLDRSSSGLYGLLLINAAFGFLVPGIAWEAHLGGFLAGMASGAIVAFTGGRDKRHLHWAAFAALTALLVALAAVKYAVTG